MQGKRVLITGGFGFIGSNLAKACAERGAHVSILDSLDTRSGANRGNLQGIDAQILSGDIRDRDVCNRAVVDQDIVLHCAALTSHVGSQTDAVEYVKTNCLGTLNVLDAMCEVSPDGRFVTVGTSTQIGPMLTPEIDERHPEFPLDMYSATKVGAEKFTLAHASSRGLHASVVRLGNVYGPRAHIKTPKFGFVNYFIGLALQGRAITVYGDGSQLRNLTFVEDCVDAIIAVSESDGSKGEVYFAAADNHISVADIANNIVAHLGGSLSFIAWPDDRKVIEVGDAIINNAKIKRDLGWFAKTPLTDGLQTTRKYYQKKISQYI